MLGEERLALAKEGQRLFGLLALETLRSVHMLTYRIVASTGLLPNVSSILGVARKWPDQNPKKTKQANCDFPDFII